MRKTAEDEEKAAASMRLAYQDLSLQSKKTEAKMRTMDPKKAAEVERLGMGVSGKSSAISHSAITEMSTIEQEEPRGGTRGGGFSGGSRNSSGMFGGGGGGSGGRFQDDSDDFGGFGGDRCVVITLHSV